MSSGWAEASLLAWVTVMVQELAVTQVRWSVVGEMVCCPVG
jgi:hypothetical protein